MAYQDLRDFLNRLDGEGELLRIPEELDPRFEIAALVKELGRRRGPAILVEKVKGHTTPMAGNLLGTRRRLALALETEEGAFIEEYLERKKRALAPKKVTQGLVKQVIVRDNIDIPAFLPVLTYHSEDASPYITQGLVFMKDPETGAQTMGIHRIQVKGGDRLGMFLASKTSNEFLRKAEERGKPLEVAIAIGLDPTWLIAATAWMPFGDKFQLAGGLRGEPAELIAAETVDLDIPAHAMFVLEGEVQPGVREEDGPFGEANGYYVTANSPVVKVKAITHQREPIYSAFIPWSAEDGLIFGFAYGSEFYRMLQAEVPSVCGLNLTNVGATAVIAIKEAEKEKVKRALDFALKNFPFTKKAVVVDDDVDIYDPEEVDWAIAWRSQPDEDVIMLSGVGGHPLDLTKREGLTSKIGLIAIKPSGREQEFKKITPPEGSMEKAKGLARKYLR
jgi:2,5-furandicarboxylate decarboxylase 1